MKIFKKSILVGIFALLSLCLIKPIKTNTAEAISADNYMFEYVTVSRYGQTLTLENFVVDENYAYLVTNSSITFTLKPLEYEYTVDLGTDAIYYHKNVRTVTLEKDPTSNEFPESFEYDGVTYYYKANITSGQVTLYKQSPTENLDAIPIVSSNRSTAIEINEVDDVRTITFTTSYTLKSNAPDSVFEFSARDEGTRTYTIEIFRPILDFANAKNPIVEFECNGLDAGNTPYVENTIRREQSYNSIEISFLNNNYTEENPLYFDINYNGFTYNFKFYSMDYNGDQILFVNYIDYVKETNNKYLATHLYLNNNQEYMVDESNIVYANDGVELNTFSMIFSETGRYEIDVYDTTYLTKENSANHYNTSFYIRDKLNTPFENIYIISQTQEDDGTDIEYIVSTSTLNYNVKTTIKNLNNFGINPTTNEEIKLSDVVSKIEVITTLYGTSEHLPTHKFYTIEEIEASIVNGDFILSFVDDAYYQIFVYSTDDNVDPIYYDFTIVKHAKTSFTVPKVDEITGEPIFDSNNEQEKIIDRADTPFHSEIIGYDKNILSSFYFKTKFSLSGIAHDKSLNKTYINHFEVKFALEKVYVGLDSRVILDEDGNEIKSTTLDLEFKGIGDMIVEVTYNGTTTTYELNSEEGNGYLSFADYGVYKIKLVDSMGTTFEGSFEHKKTLNTSAILLISLSAVLVAIIAIFVLRVRGKVSTR